MAKQKIVGVIEHKLKSGISYEIRYYDSNGVRQSERVKADSKTEAFKIRQERMLAVHNGSYLKKDIINIRFSNG